MKRMALLLAVAALCAGPLPAQAASFSWNTPWTNGSLSGDTWTSGATSGSVMAGSTLIDWSANLDTIAKTAAASATVNGQEYSGSFDWNNLFSWLFF